jgi:hypothetical protein
LSTLKHADLREEGRLLVEDDWKKRRAGDMMYVD